MKVVKVYEKLSNRSVANKIFIILVNILGTLQSTTIFRKTKINNLIKIFYIFFKLIDINPYFSLSMLEH